MGKLATQTEVKSPANNAAVLNHLTSPVEDGGAGMTAEKAKDLVKDGGIYETTTVWATDTAPYHKVGEEIFCSKVVGDKMLKAGWATDKRPAKVADI
jgi:hypothetical protein